MPRSSAHPLERSLPADPSSWQDFRGVVESAADLLTVIDAEGRVLYENQAVEEFLGYLQGELVGRSAFELIHPSDYAAAVSLLAELSAGRRATASIAARFRRADGVWCVLRSTGRVLRAEGGAPHIVVTSRRSGSEGDGGFPPAAQAEELEQARLEVVERLARAAEFRDDDTGRHLRRVGELSALLAARIGLAPGEVELLHRAAPLHDVGKIGIPDAILRKPGPLDPAEEEVMRRHPLLGARILEGGCTPLIRVAEAIALSHHERWDGRGYPWRVAGEEIPLPARIVSLVDFYDALTHDRPYRRAWEPARVLELIREESGTRFDPEVARVFLAMATDFTAGDAESAEGSASSVTS